jgi:hypothetical protein
MGGLVIRDLLARMVVRRQQDYITRVRMIYFFGTPASGAKAADFAKLLPFVGSTQLPALVSLVDNDYLQNQQRAWRESPELQKISAYCRYETVAVPLAGRVVSQESASEPCPNHAESIMGSHLDMVKPAGRNADPYRALSLAVGQIKLESLGLPTTPVRTVASHS